jgi:PhzF family phenazine biosynthesis protein
MGVKQAPFYQLDAFTEVPFKGNPAAICLMPTNLKNELYISIAKEMNLSETAFLEKKASGEYALRWFTPKHEVPLCGHATLAAAYLVFNLGYDGKAITFHTKSGELYAHRAGDGILMDFPRNDPFPVPILPEINEALGVSPIETQFSDSNMKLLVEVESEDEVRKISPNFQKLLECQKPYDWYGIIVTSRSHEYDFISRYFAPWRGINEDPVTGSAHTVLGPYWSKKLGKDKMRAYQASERGGEIGVELTDLRVHLTGQSVMVVEGTLTYSL